MCSWKRELSQKNLPATEKREIRIFISSTFRDMMQERDLLVKQVFPELRRKCAKRLVTFTEVDLRWGITEEQAAEGQVLPLCLAEIERSRPYFFGLLGERYGWIPEDIRPEVIEREPWLKEHVHGYTSVTELEILHGVLNDLKMRNKAFFYFRDPAYAKDPFLSPEERKDMVEKILPSEVEKYGEAEALRLLEERKSKLLTLKQRIRDSNLPVQCYANPEALAKIVRKQFDELIDQLYPEELAPDAVTQERLAHESYAKNKLFACIDRPNHLAALNVFASQPDHGEKGLVLTGESGSGKTALLAAWARDWGAAHPATFLFQHYFGATPDSATPEGFLRRLLGELKNHFDITDDIPTKQERLQETLTLWLTHAAARGRVVLLLDGLNQIQGGEAECQLNFLPRHFPPRVTVLASALPSPALDTLRERNWVEYSLPHAGEAEADAMAGEYLRIHARTLEPTLRRQLVTAPGAKSPLFLRTVLEELRQFGSFEQLPAHVDHYLEARQPKELFLRVIRRWQEDFDQREPEQDKSNPGLVHRALTHLWAARHGLSESEWLDLLGADIQPSYVNSTGHEPKSTLSPLPRAYWTPLFLALEPHLSQRAGLYAFGHDFLRQAVEELFLSDSNGRFPAHLALAGYFEYHPSQSEMNPRKAAEWPYHLNAAGAWERLEECLTHFPLFLFLFEGKMQWELTGYWHSLRERGRDIGECYTLAYREWVEASAGDREQYLSGCLGQFLSANGLYNTAEPFLRSAMETCEEVFGPEHPDTFQWTNCLAVLLEKKGDYTGAEPLYRRSLEWQKRMLGSYHPATLTTTNNLAVLLKNKGDYEGAETLYRRALEARERVLGYEDPDTLVSLNNLALLLVRKGDSADAGPLLRRTLETRKRVLGSEHPDTLKSMNNLAMFLESEGDRVSAEQLLRRTLETRKRVLGPEHPDTLANLSDIAFLLGRKGDYACAEPLLRRTLETREQLLGQDNPDTIDNMNNLAFVLEMKGDYKSAEQLYVKAIEGLLKISAVNRRPHPELHTFLGNYAGCLEKLGRSPRQIRKFLDTIMRPYGIRLR